MGVENEDFIGNPNKVEFTDDELEYDDGYEVGDVIWFGEEEDISDNNLDVEPLFHYFQNEVDDDWYDENNDDDDDDDADNDYEINADNFLSDEESVSSDETEYGQSSSEESQVPPEGNDIDNNEVVKTIPTIDTNNTNSSPSEPDGDTGQVAPQ